MDKTCVNCKGSGKQIRWVPIMRGLVTIWAHKPCYKGIGKEEEE